MAGDRGDSLPQLPRPVHVACEELQEELLWLGSRVGIPAEHNSNELHNVLIGKKVPHLQAASPFLSLIGKRAPLDQALCFGDAETMQPGGEG